MGYIKAKSRVSLVTSVVFAALLALCVLQVIPYVVSDWLLGLLIVVFVVRVAKTRKMMPAGMLAVLTFVVLALKHLLPAG